MQKFSLRRRLWVEAVFKPNDFCNNERCTRGRAISDQRENTGFSHPSMPSSYETGQHRVISIKWAGSVLARIYIPMRRVQLKIWIAIRLDRVLSEDAVHTYASLRNFCTSISHKASDSFCWANIDSILLWLWATVFIFLCFPWQHMKAELLHIV